MYFVIESSPTSYSVIGTFNKKNDAYNFANDLRLGSHVEYCDYYITKIIG